MGLQRPADSVKQEDHRSRYARDNHPASSAVRTGDLAAVAHEADADMDAAPDGVARTARRARERPNSYGGFDESLWLDSRGRSDFCADEDIERFGNPQELPRLRPIRPQLEWRESHVRSAERLAVATQIEVSAAP